MNDFVKLAAINDELIEIGEFLTESRHECETADDYVAVFNEAERRLKASVSRLDKLRLGKVGMLNRVHLRKVFEAAIKAAHHSGKCEFDIAKKYEVEVQEQAQRFAKAVSRYV